ncbi:hypothetical protein LF599_04305 [Pseudodesulfovibrio thermohalotolerans]|uniref:hypothetical protein n=1 Tax=Pseudodesulfovibrio thermohalotolerans TaxID=2880651 RepID=UPI00244187D1|nr:hypothetical protein [Pseudodesulfovibrio thermohalotolerans]WFS64325.1 hypothetical protein LF599_04305 [Pseudodesulfovibrio thermohalotolerans]
MPIIAVEGLDASGKTTIAALLAKSIGCDLVEKPLRWVLQHSKEKDLDSYYAVVNRVNTLDSAVARQWFHCFGWLLIANRYRDSIVVVDRYVLSNLSYNNHSRFDDICNLALSVTEPPTFTVLLNVSTAERRRRLSLRSPSELKSTSFDKDKARFALMKNYLIKQGWLHAVITTDGRPPQEIVDVITPSLKSIV